jgi:hypothetical protein
MRRRPTSTPRGYQFVPFSPPSRDVTSNRRAPSVTCSLPSPAGATEEDRAFVAYDDRFVRHSRHVGTARGARAHRGSDLRHSLGREVSLVEKDSPEVKAVGKDLVLRRQVRAAAVDQGDARQPVLRGDLLSADAS